MNSQHQQTVDIEGMHCAACEVLIERAWRQLPGVDKVIIKRSKNRAHIFCQQAIPLDKLNEVINEHGYRVVNHNSTKTLLTEKKQRSLADKLTDVGAVTLILAVIYIAARGFGFEPSSLGVTDQMSFGFIFLLGLVASFSSCMSVTGGLLLSIIATQRELHPELTGRQIMRSQIFFNVGRIASYTIFGAIIGAIGSALTLSPVFSGIILILASVFMLLLGLQLLDIFPWLQRFQIRLPKKIAHTIYGQSGKPLSAAGPLWFGAATFFFPCGFTQALQLYVLSQGDWFRGGLTMLIFSLGTMPALVSIAALTSFLKGQWLHFIQVGAGVLVIVLAIANIGNGLALTGATLPLPATKTVEQTVPIVNGVQVVNMKVQGYNYQPAQFTIKAGIPVEWRIDSAQAAGCAHVIVARNIGVQEILPGDSIKSIRFTADKPGKIAFSCPMGMTTPGAAFTVIN